MASLVSPSDGTAWQPARGTRSGLSTLHYSFHTAHYLLHTTPRGPSWTRPMGQVSMRQRASWWRMLSA